MEGLDVVKGFRGVLRTAGASEAFGFDSDSSSLLLVWAEVIDMLSGAVKSITLVDGCLLKYLVQDHGHVELAVSHQPLILSA